ncbi:DUF4127 family protein [Paenibacillus sp. 19GGS1-52]|uniref:DUF4127 family protein n=1 Tax=Paenibacillus sp. 19GGS1-52 TaxID=2758563 RepID=UPI001EFC1877|nr:DUF4127 family protein [Paenibacillus sp. 19GGS1-52]ULO09423.1 DUF4127 family protein [Paenibacillus sp. 19GGS1-52]
MGNIHADVHVIADWLLTETRDANALIISVDMLVYGGIVPSRLHYLTEKECAEPQPAHLYAIPLPKQMLCSWLTPRP